MAGLPPPGSASECTHIVQNLCRAHPAGLKPLVPVLTAWIDSKGRWQVRVQITEADVLLASMVEARAWRMAVAAVCTSDR